MDSQKYEKKHNNKNCLHCGGELPPGKTKYCCRDCNVLHWHNANPGYVKKDPDAVSESCRLRGLKGGKARAEKLTAAQRSEISRKGGATHRIKQIKVLHKCPNCEKIYYKLLPGNTTDKKIYEFCPKCEFLRYTPDTVAMEYRLRA